MKLKQFLRFLRPSSNSLEQPDKEILVQLDCHAINRESGAIDVKARALEFATAAPNCVCELYTTSPHSPGVINDGEMLTRFIFSPIHINKKTGAVLSSAFSYANTSGCSVQREGFASAEELNRWLTKYLESNSEHHWMGTLDCNSALVKSLVLHDSPNRVVGVYDTAEENNPAHAEIFRTEHVITDADALEVKRELLKKFNGGVLTKPQSFRKGHLFEGLTEVLKNRVGLSAF